MRLMRLIPAALVLLITGPAFGQGWINYVSPEDLFSINLPGEPEVQELTYSSEYGVTLPSRVYRYKNGDSLYSITVVDYADTEKFHIDRVQQCMNSEGDGDLCQNNWRTDVQGSIVYATWKFLQRDAKITHYAWYFLERIEGHRIQLTNADQSRTYAVIHRHGTRLYILEANTPEGAPEPGLFQQSLQFQDEEGRLVRYEALYTTGYGVDWRFPAPPPTRDHRTLVERNQDRDVNRAEGREHYRAPSVTENSE